MKPIVHKVVKPPVETVVKPPVKKIRRRIRKTKFVKPPVETVVKTPVKKIRRRRRIQKTKVMKPIVHKVVKPPVETVVKPPVKTVVPDEVTIKKRSPYKFNINNISLPDIEEIKLDPEESRKNEIKFIKLSKNIESYTISKYQIITPLDCDLIESFIDDYVLDLTGAIICDYNTSISDRNYIKCVHKATLKIKLLIGNYILSSSCTEEFFIKKTWVPDQHIINSIFALIYTEHFIYKQRLVLSSAKIKKSQIETCIYNENDDQDDIDLGDEHLEKEIIYLMEDIEDHFRVEMNEKQNKQVYKYLRKYFINKYNDPKYQYEIYTEGFWSTFWETVENKQMRYIFYEETLRKYLKRYVKLDLDR